MERYATAAVARLRRKATPELLSRGGKLVQGVPTVQILFASPELCSEKFSHLLAIPLWSLMGRIRCGDQPSIIHDPEASGSHVQLQTMLTDSLLTYGASPERKQKSTE